MRRGNCIDGVQYCLICVAAANYVKIMHALRVSLLGKKAPAKKDYLKPLASQLLSHIQTDIFCAPHV